MKLQNAFGKWHLVGHGWFAGFHTRGNCWTFELSKLEFSTCTHYRLWRFFVSVDK